MNASKPLTLPELRCGLPTWLPWLLIIGMLANTACSTRQWIWRPVNYDSQAIWADDATEVAIVRISYEEKQSLDPLNGTTDKRNFRHQIILQKPDGTDRRALTVPRPHQTGRLYYMRTAGYLIVEVLQPELGAAYFEKLSLRNEPPVRLLDIPPLTQWGCQDSHSQPPLSQGDPPESPGRLDYTVLPSPDGAHLLLGYSPTCQQVRLELRRADNLLSLWQKNLPLPEPANLTWHPAGHAILAGFRQAWQINLDGTVVPAPLPNCLIPATTSSDINAHHQSLAFGPNGLEIISNNDSTVFGCQ